MAGWPSVSSSAPKILSNRLGAFEWRPDAEGRYQVNECYCHDTTWQQALAELLKVSDGVLMDLRNLSPPTRAARTNCKPRPPRRALHRVVVLINERTELAAAQAATAAASCRRFVWLASRAASRWPPTRFSPPCWLRVKQRGYVPMDNRPIITSYCSSACNSPKV